MSSEQESPGDQESIKDVVEVRHLCVESLWSIVEELKTTSSRFRGLKGLSPDVRSDLVMLWRDTLGNLVTDVAQRKGVADSDNTLGNLAVSIPLIDDTEVAGMISEVDEYNSGQIESFAETVDKRIDLN